MISKKLPIAFVCLLFIAGLLISHNKISTQEIKKQQSTVPQINLIRTPSSVSRGETATITWEVVSPTNDTINSTLLYYDYQSSPSAYLDVTPADSGYQLVYKDFDEVNTTSPQAFSADLEPEATIYYRIYAKLGHTKHAWSPEFTLKVK